MARTIMPIFESFQGEGKIVGRLVTGYGELEFRLFACLASTMGSDEDAARVFFAVRGEENRIQTAHKRIRSAFRQVGLAKEYMEAIADMSWCRLVRNQYAHSHWYQTEPTPHRKKFGLSILNLERSAKESSSGPIMARRDYINIGLLRQQEAYFVYVRDCLEFLEVEYQRVMGKIPNHACIRPQKIARPRKYSDNPIY